MVEKIEKESFDQTVVDRITETENLTDNMQDTDAQWLIDWGIAKAKVQVKDAKDEDAAGDKINAVMDVMRKLNKFASDYATKKPDELRAGLTEIAGSYAAAFGSARQMTDAEYSTLAAELGKKSPHEALEQIVNALAPDTKAAATSAKTKHTAKP